MSEAESALGGAAFEGLVRIEDAGLRGMITVRGDLSSTALKEAVTSVAGVGFPDRRGANCVGDRGLLWMSPDELLVLVPYDEAGTVVATLSQVLKGKHHLVADVSDARCLFLISSDRAREVLAKLTPADLHPDAFGPGELRRTRLAQVAAAFWMRDEKTLELVCFRSVADYVFELLKTAARPGSEVGHF